MSGFYGADYDDDGNRAYDPENPLGALEAVLDIEDSGKRASQTIRALQRMVAAGMDLPAEAEVRSYVLRKRILPTKTFDKAIREARRSARSQDTAAEANQATQLQALAREHFRMVTAEDGKNYAVPLDGPNAAISLGRRFTNQLSRLYLEKTGSAPGSQALSTTTQILLAYLDGQEPEPVHIRLARDGNNVVLDLGTRDGRCVIVDSSGWRIEEHSPVLFRRAAGTPLPEPVRGDGGLDKLRNLVNLNEEQFRLGVAWLVASLVPGIPHPILVPRGEQGTAKTTLARIFQRLIDPSHLEPGALPDNEKDLAVRMHNAYVQAFDNASSIPELLSDALCRATTGGTFAGRMLYSDDEITVLTYLRVIILTTVEAGQLRPDLVERMLPLDLERIGPDKRRTERAVIGDDPDEKPGIFDLLDQGHPEILGALLDLLSGVLKQIPDVAISHLPRMADFAKILAAIDADQGWKTFALYSQLVDSETGALVEGDPFVSALVEFMEDRDEWSGTATKLLTELSKMLPDQDHPPKKWPADGPRAGGKLKRMAPSLRVHGIEYETGKGARGSTRTLKVTKTLSAPSLLSAIASDQEKQADSKADSTVPADSSDGPRRTVRTVRTVEDSSKTRTVRPETPGQGTDPGSEDSADSNPSEKHEEASIGVTESSGRGCAGPLDPVLLAAGFTTHGADCEPMTPLPGAP